MSDHRPTPGRHASGRVRRLPDLPFVTGPSGSRRAKAIVGFGLLVGSSATYATHGTKAPDSGSIDASPVSDQQAALLLKGRDQTAAARSAVRAGAPAVVVPAGAKAASGGFGTLGFRAIAKPAVTRTSSSGTSSSSSVPSADSRLLAEARALGLGPNASKVYAAIRTVFPEIGTIGGYRAGDPGDHGTGHAVDIMCTTSQGNRIVPYLQAHASELHIKYVIWQQRIWFPGSNTWELMEDRGSATANHFDHVHVSVY